MKQVLLGNWTFIRILRLIMGIAIIMQAIAEKNLLFGAVGFLLTIMPLLNIGCCAAGNCTVVPRKKESDLKETRYEEVV